ncbi:amidohydrolase family protein [Pseudonocardia terrae]|uniref:amidohydrolase family protein n=1 Tax=Pseudonocardia terrae TaxID=2905831 RepID=UPI0027DFF650|nr:amidohydrolase family protein [Pseudonocardia terrae]
MTLQELTGWLLRALWFPGVIFEAICACIPRERAEKLHPNRNLLDAGVLLAGGSDWPVMPSPNPWYGIQGLVSRADPTGAFPGTLWPEQGITLAEALHAYTLGAARAMGTDDVAGSLEVGKSADFVVLDRDPFAVPVNRLAGTSPSRPGSPDARSTTGRAAELSRPTRECTVSWRPWGRVASGRSSRRQ